MIIGGMRVKGAVHLISGLWIIHLILRNKYVCHEKGRLT